LQYPLINIQVNIGFQNTPAQEDLLLMAQKLKFSQIAAKESVQCEQ
jgi:hypothetical protein